ncbi:hypothetical protein NW768_006844 [Fusarium equiseti]|uniref:Uncharacterized protein n=1 Tax=Fusarium equiseti TaxID=61235 RepID=A0ABQ8R9I4_FUSEQ|nr:hypothetical protein NW768_006844 [Fusarium equiseti]
MNTAKVNAGKGLRWVKKTADDNNRVTIISLRIPNSAIENLSSTQLARAYFPSDEWKKIVWYSRNGWKPPTELNHFSTALLVIGSISRRLSGYFQKLGTWSQIVAKDLIPMASDGNPIQYAFSTEYDAGFCGEHFLKMHAGNVTLREYTKKHFLVWLEANKNR